MTMNEKNLIMKNEKIINPNCSYYIVAIKGCKIIVKTIKASCKWQLITHSCNCIGYILGDFF
jgi:hypothetical protein